MTPQKPFFTEKDCILSIWAKQSCVPLDDANAKILPLVEELRSLHLMVEGNEIEYASLKQESERLREQVARLEEATTHLMVCLTAYVDGEKDCGCESGNSSGPGFICGFHKALDKAEKALEGK